MSLYLVIGPMFSGKTTQLIQRVMQYSHAGKRVVFVKPALDNRYSRDNIVSHDYMQVPAVKTSLLMECRDLLEFDVIGIDEIQFFLDAVEACVYFAKRGKIVVAAGLNGDAHLKPWVPIPGLIPHCDVVDYRAAICKCGGNAIYTLRNSKSDALIEIGGAENYTVFCRKCYNDQMDC